MTNIFTPWISRPDVTGSNKISYMYIVLIHLQVLIELCSMGSGYSAQLIHADLSTPFHINRMSQTFYAQEMSVHVDTS